MMNNMNFDKAISDGSPDTCIDDLEKRKND